MSVTLRVLRVKKGYNRYQLSDLTGLPVSQLGYIERRNHLIRERYINLLKIANAFDMTIEELVKLNEKDRNEE